MHKSRIVVILETVMDAGYLELGFSYTIASMKIIEAMPTFCVKPCPFRLLLTYLPTDLRFFAEEH